MSVGGRIYVIHVAGPVERGEQRCVKCAALLGTNGRVWTEGDFVGVPRGGLLGVYSYTAGLDLDSRDEVPCIVTAENAEPFVSVAHRR